MLRYLVHVLLALLVVVPLPAEQDVQQLPILGLARAYVERFIDELSRVVAEERYSQEAESPRRKRTLRSDVVVARDPDAKRWYTFREVLDVDGKPVQEARGGRLARLMADPGRDTLLKAQEITVAGLRYNVENIGTVNNPLLALSFLRAEYSHRFRFMVGGRDKKFGPRVRKVSFEEVQTPTVLTVEGNRDLPAYGAMWIDEGTGRVLKTELRLGEKPAVSTGHTSSSLGWAPPTTIVTTFGVDEGLGIDVPLEMRDRYPFQRNEIKGVASYGPFRRLPGRSSR
jgi:hypothetical protein